MHTNRSRDLTRRGFLKRSGALGLAATAAGMTGSLMGCPAGAWKAGRMHTLEAASASLTPAPERGPFAYDLTLVGVAGAVAWADEDTAAITGTEPLGVFLTQSWTAAFAALPPNGTIDGVIAGSGTPMGFRLLVERMTAGLTPGKVLARAQCLGELWSVQSSHRLGTAITLEQATLHLLPTALDYNDPEQVIIHRATSVAWAASATPGRDLLTLGGVAEFAGWLQSGPARLGGRLDLEELVADWATRFANAHTQAWLWQTNANGEPVARLLMLHAATHDPDADTLIFEAEDTDYAAAKQTTGGTLLMAAGDAATTPDTVDFNAMRFTRDQLWVLREGNAFTLGITHYAAEQLSDVVYVDYDVDQTAYELDEQFCLVEAVKAIAELYTPLSCQGATFNPSLYDEPHIINDDPYGRGWIVKATSTDFSPLDNAMNYAQYQDYLRQIS